MLNEIFKKFDRYTLNARLRPAFLCLLPAILFLAVMFPKVYETIRISFLFILIMCGILLLLSNTVRYLGRRLEVKLYALWNGTPSTIWLRHHDDNLDPITKNRYHNFFQKNIPNFIIPTPNDEITDPKNTDNYYASAISWLIEHTRNKKKYPLLFEENINYGFRRNLLALKPIALIILIICSIITILVNYLGNDIVNGSLAKITILISTIVGLSFFWIYIVSPDWVKDASYTYVKRLLNSCDKET